MYYNIRVTFTCFLIVYKKLRKYSFTKNVVKLLLSIKFKKTR